MAIATFTILQGSDDAREIAGAVTINSITSGDIDATNRYLGLRFDNVTGLDGETINHAEIDVYIHANTGDEPNHDVYGIAEDDTGTFTTAGSNISGRTLTTATTHIGDGTDLGLSENSVMTITGVGPIVEEIITRPGWSNGNAIGFVIQGGATATHDLAIKMFEYTGPLADQPAGTYAAVLRVNYGTPDAPSERHLPRGLLRGLTRGLI